jgi:hypothetical protein
LCLLSQRQAACPAQHILLSEQSMMGGQVKRDPLDLIKVQGGNNSSSSCGNNEQQPVSTTRLYVSSKWGQPQRSSTSPAITLPISSSVW